MFQNQPRPPPPKKIHSSSATELEIHVIVPKDRNEINSASWRALRSFRNKSCQDANKIGILYLPKKIQLSLQMV